MSADTYSCNLGAAWAVIDTRLVAHEGRGERIDANCHWRVGQRLRTQGHRCQSKSGTGCL
eukprot:1195602-Prorocentrum_minimum.AAC.7